MSVLNQLIEAMSGYQSTPETEEQLFLADGSTTEMVKKTRARRVGNVTTAYSGGSLNAALAKKDALEAIPNMGEIYMYPTGPDEWTVIATLRVLGAWGAWV